MASSAIVNGVAKLHAPEPKGCEAMLSGGFFLSNHLAVAVMTAGGAHMMRALTLAAIRALHMPDRLQGVMGAAHCPRRDLEVFFFGTAMFVNSREYRRLEKAA